MTGLPAPAETWIFAAFIFLFGLAFGSFLNVCIYRLPRELSVVAPASACPNCHAAIKAYDNIPVASWLILGGKCRNCKRRITPRYAIVELLTGLLFLACFLRFGLTLETLKFCIFSFLVLGLIFTDWETQLLPDALTKPGFVIGIIFSFFVPVGGLFRWTEDLSISWRWVSFAGALLGAALGAGLILAAGYAYKLARHVEGMGFGDVKLMAMVGAFLGMRLTLFTLIAATISGALFSVCEMGIVYLKRRSRYARMNNPNPGARAKAAVDTMFHALPRPFGVFLGAAALAGIFFGKEVVAWYWGLLQ